MLYTVWVPEVWYQEVQIEAENAEEAIELVQNGDGVYLDDRLEYSHTLDKDETDWDVQEA